MTEQRKKDWKDSSWYVNTTSFIRQYSRHRMGVVGFGIIILFALVAVFAPYLATHDPNPSVAVGPKYLAPGWMQIFDPNPVITGEYLSDTNLTDSAANKIAYYGNQTYGVGSSFAGEFEPGRMRLRWSHVPGDSPGFVPVPLPMSNMPDSLSFVYFYQELDWPIDRMPSDAIITFRLSVALNGSFAQFVDGVLMFRVYVWLIDSSGNWTLVYRTSPPYSETGQSRRHDLSPIQVFSAWAGMVPQSPGVPQQDPEDVLKVAVGLAPTYMFKSSNAYLNYNGSVTVDVSYLSAYVYGQYFGVMGTTNTGSDAWSQLVYGSRVSLFVGISATALSTFIGVIVGIVAGYFGGKIDELLMRVVDFLLVIPGLPLMMILAAFLGTKIENIIIVIAILGWTGTARLIRSQVLAERNKAYVESARAIGSSDTYIMFRHILPNVTPILFANITLGVVGAILSEAGLSFLGLTDPSAPTWGRMLSEAHSSGGFSQGAWWVVIFPGMTITALSLAFTFVGHTLDQVLNPRLRER